MNPVKKDKHHELCSLKFQGLSPWGGILWLEETSAFLETNPAAGYSRGQSVPPALGPRVCRD